MSKALVKSLPRDREYSEVEAVFSLQCNYDNGNEATISGFAASWRWSRKRVSNFFTRLGIIIEYPKDTQKQQNQRGQIALQIRNRCGTDKEQIRLIDSKDLRPAGNRSGTDREQIGNRSGSTIKEPNPKPDSFLPENQAKKEKNPSKKNTIVYSDSFLKFWEQYPNKKAKGTAFRAWKKIPKDNGYLEIIISAIQKQKYSDQWKKDNGQFIPHPSTWLNGRQWEDEAFVPPKPRKEYIKI